MAGLLGIELSLPEERDNGILMMKRMEKMRGSDRLRWESKVMGFGQPN